MNDEKTTLVGKLRRGLLHIKRSVYKPGSVRWWCHRDGHFSRSTIARTLQQPTRGVLIEMGALTAYLALLQLGFTMPFVLPRTRWALTPPFHPYPFRGGLFSVALSVTPVSHRAQALPGSLAHGARTFLELVSEGC